MKLSLTICRDIIQSFFIKFSEEARYKTRNTRSVMFCYLRSNVISFLLL